MATSIRRGEEYHTIGTRPRRSTSLRAPFLASDTAGDGRPRYDGPLAKMDRTEDNAADNLGHQRRKSREGNTRGWDGRGDHGDRDDDDDDVELDELLSGEDDADEETDLTKEHGQQKKRKRRRHSLVDGGPSISKQEKKLADANVVRKLLVNALFMGLWYAFSLSISIVSDERVLMTVESALMLAYSTTSGCSLRNTSISSSLSSPPACTCWCSSFWAAWCCILSPSTGPVQTVSPIHMVWMGRY